jgi:uncharacterized protein (TIGR00369 family)
VAELPEWAVDFDSQVDRKIGIEFLEVTPARTVGRMPVEGNTQPAGLLHGGASLVMVETLATVCAYAELGDTQHAFGAEINVSHVNPATSGWVVGTAEAVRVGGTLGVYQVTLVNNGTTIAVGRATVRLMRPR